MTSDRSRPPSRSGAPSPGETGGRAERAGERHPGPAPVEGDPIRILFVCLGNICRSPLAEGVFLHLVREAGVEDRYHVESAGTGAWHVGERPDRRSIEVARRHGVGLDGCARQVERDDFSRFDLVVAMDEQNRRDLEALSAPSPRRARVRLLREFDPQGEGDLDVPDPYYGGPGGFDRVYAMVRRSCEALLQELEGQANGV